MKNRRLLDLKRNLMLARDLRTIGKEIELPFPISKAFNILGKDIEMICYEYRTLLDLLDNNASEEDLKMENYKQQSRIKLSVLEWESIKELVN